jgi:hypothetical protein
MATFFHHLRFLCTKLSLSSWLLAYCSRAQIADLDSDIEHYLICASLAAAQYKYIMAIESTFMATPGFFTKKQLDRRLRKANQMADRDAYDERRSTGVTFPCCELHGLLHFSLSVSDFAALAIAHSR